MHVLLEKIIREGQNKNEIKNELPTEEIASYFPPPAPKPRICTKNNPYGYPQEEVRPAPKWEIIVNRHSVVSKFYFTYKLGKQILGFESIAVFISLLNLFPPLVYYDGKRLRRELACADPRRGTPLIPPYENQKWAQSTSLFSEGICK